MSRIPVEENVASGYRWLRELTVHRAVTLSVALALVLLGIYPGPSLVLMRDPAWRADIAVRRFVEESAFWTTGLLIIIGPAIVLASMTGGAFDRFWESFRTRAASIRDRWFVAGAAVFAAIAAATVAAYVLSKKPTTSDEVAQLWHARILLSGRLALPADPNPEFFAVDNVIDQGRWYSQFPIGGPAIYALALLLRGAWLLNPLLAGLTVVNVYRFALRAYGPGEARVAAVLSATCPFLLLMSGTYMNHTIVLFLATLALAELPAWMDDDTNPRRRMAAMVIGLSIGVAIAVRPLDGAIAALALGVVMLHHAVRHAAAARSLVWTVLAGAVPVVALTMANWLTTGQPLRFGYDVLWGANHALGFHDAPTGVPHTPARALALATAYVAQLNWALFEWPIAGLLIVSGALVVMGRIGRWGALLLIWIGVQLAAYAVYWHAGTLFGPRYLFTVVPAFLLICARGLVIAERRASVPVRRALVAGVGASLLSSWLVPMTPVGALGSAEGTRPLRAAFKVDLDPIVQSIEGTNALVFVNETASARLMRRLWGLGISRVDAAKLMATRDNCSLLELVAAEAQRPGPTSERLTRLGGAKAYAPLGGSGLRAPDAAFRITDRQSLTPLCNAEMALDASRRTAVSFGQALLRNEIGSDGRITGPVVFVADLSDHNEALRARFGDRVWYRLEVGGDASNPSPRVVPYR